MKNFLQIFFLVLVAAGTGLPHGSAGGSQSFPSATAFDRQYTYTLRGQIETVDDHVDSSYDQSFIYDGLGQLTTATGKWGSATYTYDAIGNITSKVFSDWESNGNRAVNMTYDGLNRLASYTDDGPGGNKALTYDARGNVTALGNLTMTYDMADQPTFMVDTGNVDATYYYDGNLKRVRSDITTGSGPSAVTKTLYNVYDKSGALVFVDKETDGEEITTVRGAGMTIARIKEDTTTGVETITYIHTDHLGSTSTATDTSGTVLWREHHSPYGEVLNPQTANDNLAAFTGHIRDADTGLSYMQARYYDPVGARFLSIDPVTFAAGGRTGMFNRYSYTFNDPVNAIDPDGLEPCSLKGCSDQMNIKTGEIKPTDTNPNSTSNRIMSGIVTNFPGVGVVESRVKGEKVHQSIGSGIGDLPPLKASKLKKYIKPFPEKKGAGGKLQPYDPKTGRYLSKDVNKIGNSPAGQFTQGLGTGFSKTDVLPYPTKAGQRGVKVGKALRTLFDKITMQAPD